MTNVLFLLYLETCPWSSFESSSDPLGRMDTTPKVISSEQVTM